MKWNYSGFKVEFRALVLKNERFRDLRDFDGGTTRYPNAELGSKGRRLLAAEGEDPFPGLSLWIPPRLSSPCFPHPNIQILLQ